MIRALLWVFFVSESLTAICRLLLLARVRYPRQVTWSRNEDAAAVFFAVCIAVLLLFVLIGGGS